MVAIAVYRRARDRPGAPIVEPLLADTAFLAWGGWWRPPHRAAGGAGRDPAAGGGPGGDSGGGGVFEPGSAGCGGGLEGDKIPHGFSKVICYW